MPIIAEDLGVITPDVDALRKKFGLPGHAHPAVRLAGDASDRFLPHNYEPDTVVYTGTHDNDTVAGWWAEATDTSATSPAATWPPTATTCPGR
jgi:4-alpha-glucanotransferase